MWPQLPYLCAGVWVNGLYLDQASLQSQGVIHKPLMTISFLGWTGVWKSLGDKNKSFRGVLLIHSPEIFPRK